MVGARRDLTRQDQFFRPASLHWPAGGGRPWSATVRWREAGVLDQRSTTGITASD